MGDIIAGCLLGPTVLQDLQLVIFPPENRALLKLFGYFGLILPSPPLSLFSVGQCAVLMAHIMMKE